MKQINDNFTIEIPTFPKRRGRPPSPDTLDAVARKRLQFERDQALAVAGIWSEVTGGGLIRFLSSANPYSLRAWRELGNRRGFSIGQT